MRDGRGARQGETGNDGQDGGEGHGRDEAVEQVAAHGLGQQHGSHVGGAGTSVDDAGGGVGELGVGEHDGDGTEADDEDQQVEVADPGRGPEHRLAGFTGIGHGEEAHQDVGQAGGTEHQCHAEGQGGDGILDEAAGAHQGQSVLVGFFRAGTALGGDVGLDAHGIGKQRFQAEAIVLHDHEAHEGDAEEQQHGLDDLHPGGGRHAAEEHVDHHQHADDDDGDPVVESEEQLDELACTDHLGDEVEGDGHECAGSGKHPDGLLLEAVAGHVGKGELAEVAQAFGQQEGEDGPADQEAERVEQAIIAAGHDGCGDAQEGGCGHEVAGDGQTVLEAGDAATGGVEVGGGAGASGGPLGDPERGAHEGGEQDDGRPVGGLAGDFADIDAGGMGRGGAHQAEGGQGDAEGKGLAVHCVVSFRISRVMAS